MQYSFTLSVMWFNLYSDISNIEQCCIPEQSCMILPYISTKCHDNRPKIKELLFIFRKQENHSREILTLGRVMKIKINHITSIHSA